MYGKITAFLGQKFELNGLTIGSPWVWWKVICQMALFPCELTPFCFWLSKNAPRTLCSTVSKKRRGWVFANSCQMTWWLSFWNGSNYSFLRDFNTIYSSCRIYAGKLQQLKSFHQLFRPLNLYPENRFEGYPVKSTQIFFRHAPWKKLGVILINQKKNQVSTLKKSG